jgi:hypothetical protein
VTLKERWTAFSPRERYLLIAAVVVALIVVARYSPLGSLGSLSFSDADDRWVQIRKIENYQKILARSAAVEVQGRLLRERYETAQQRLLAGATPTQVGAELQGRISSMAGDAGLNVLSSQILKEEDTDDFRRVGVRLTLSGELDGVARLLSAIESGNATMGVTLLEINRKLGATRRPTTSRSTSASQASLTATMEVKTFMRRDT